jgi:uncharacterized membrane protein YhhN
MSKTSKAFLALFVFAFILEILGTIQYPHIRLITKPLLMPLLGLYALSLNNFQTRKIPWLLIALLFAWIGDVILMTNYTSSFIIGLSAFLIMHLIYIFLFNKHRAIGIYKQLVPIVVISIIVVAALKFFWQTTSPLQIPVAIYTIVIGTMVLFALMRWKSKHYWYVSIGSILFMVSDFLLAINKFSFSIEYSDPLIMTSYIIAQLLIVHGYIKDV